MVFLFGICYYVYTGRSEFYKYLDLNWWAVTFLLITSFLYIIVQGLLFREVVRPHNINLRFTEWFGSMVVTLMGNYVVPFAGIGFRASYLKKIYGLSYKDFTTTLSAIYVLEFLVFSLGGMLGMAFLYLSTTSVSGNPLLTLIFVSIFLFFLSILVFSPKIPSFKFKPWKTIESLLMSWYKLKQDRMLIMRLFLYTLLEFALYSAMFYFAFRAISVSVSFISIITVSAFSDFAFFVRLAPASLGTYEASIAYSVGMFGIDLAEALFVVGLMRISTVIWFFSLGPIYSHILIGHAVSGNSRV